MVDAWNLRVHDVGAVRASLATAEQLLAERDKRVAQLERRISEDAKMINDLLVSNQAAWIEWQRGKGAEEAMARVQSTLMGVGVPGADEPWATDPQAWYSANKVDPFPTCYCGRPSNIATMDVVFCCDEHLDAWRVALGRSARSRRRADRPAFVQDPRWHKALFDLPDTEGGACD